MKYFTLFCFFMVSFLFVNPQKTMSARPPEAPKGFDYKIPKTNIWVNVLGENGIKESIRSMVIKMQDEGYSRSEFDVVTICKDVGKPLSVDTDQIVRDSQWFELARITFRSCGWMENVLFKTAQKQKPAQVNFTAYCKEIPMCISKTIGIIPPATGILSNGENDYTIDCNGNLHHCDEEPVVKPAVIQ